MRSEKQCSQLFPGAKRKFTANLLEVPVAETNWPSAEAAPDDDSENVCSDTITVSSRI